MKRYTCTWFKKQTLRPTSDNLIDPFAGKYPTRIAYIIGNQQPYFGKPSRSALATLAAAIAARKDVVFEEFDRAGMFHQEYWIEGELRIHDFNRNARQYYHPHMSITGSLFKDNQYALAMIAGARQHRFYKKTSTNITPTIYHDGLSVQFKERNVRRQNRTA